jgi:autotransporter-associated beta strand protein
MKPRPPSTARLSFPLAAAIAAFSLVTPIFGAIKTWSGNTSNDASLGTNWVGNVAPVSGADWLSFSTDPTNKAPSFASDFTAVGNVAATPIINFTNTAGSFTLGGAGVLTIDAKNSAAGLGFTLIQSASAATQTINNDLVLTNTGTNTTQFNAIRSSAGTLNLGSVTDNTGKLSFQATGAAANINVASVSAVGPLVASNNVGTVTITDASLITGLFQIQSGTVVLGSSLAAGAGNTIRLSSNAATSSTLKILDGVNFSNNIINNPTSGAATQTLGLDSGTATFSGTVASNSANTTALILNAGTGATLNMTGVISGVRPMIKEGAGTVTLSANNTLTGATRSANGTLLLTSSLALQSSTVDMNAADSGAVSFGPSLTAATFGALTGSRNLSLLNTNGTPAAVTLSVGNNTATSYTYTGVLSGGNLYKIGGGAGTFTLDPGTGGSVSLNSLSANAGGALILKSGNIGTTGIDPGQAPYVMGAGARGGTLTVDGANLTVGGSRRFVIGAAASGTGNLISGSITAPVVYIGHNGVATMTQSGGTLTTDTLAHIDGGSGTYTLTGGTLIAQTIYNSTLGANAFTLNLNGGTLQARAGTTNLIRTEGNGTTQISVLLGTGNTQIDTSVSNATIARPMGDMSGQAGTFTKTGANTLTLTEANTYTGTTTVSAGTLYVTGALSNSAVTVEANGAIGRNGATTGGLGNGLTIQAGGNLDLTGATLGTNSSGILGITAGDLTLDNLAFTDLVGWDYANAAFGTYELIGGNFTVNFGSTASISPETAYDFGNGKFGYFTSGSLNAVIIPEPNVAALIGALGGILLLRRRR